MTQGINLSGIKRIFKLSRYFFLDIFKRKWLRICCLLVFSLLFSFFYGFIVSSFSSLAGRLFVSLIKKEDERCYQENRRCDEGLGGIGVRDEDLFSTIFFGCEHDDTNDCDDPSKETFSKIYLNSNKRISFGGKKKEELVKQVNKKWATGVTLSSHIGGFQNFFSCQQVNVLDSKGVSNDKPLKLIDILLYKEDFYADFLYHYLRAEESFLEKEKVIELYKNKAEAISKKGPVTWFNFRQEFENTVVKRFNSSKEISIKKADFIKNQNNVEKGNEKRNKEIDLACEKEALLKILLSFIAEEDAYSIDGLFPIFPATLRFCPPAKLTFIFQSCFDLLYITCSAAFSNEFHFGFLMKECLINSIFFFFFSSFIVSFFEIITSEWWGKDKMDAMIILAYPGITRGEIFLSKFLTFAGFLSLFSLVGFVYPFWVCWFLFGVASIVSIVNLFAISFFMLLIAPILFSFIHYLLSNSFFAIKIFKYLFFWSYFFCLLKEFFISLIFSSKRVTDNPILFEGISSFLFLNKDNSFSFTGKAFLWFIKASLIVERYLVLLVFLVFFVSLINFFYQSYLFKKKELK